MFSLPSTVTVAGREVPVRTDFRVILEIFVMLSDPTLSDADKTEALLRMFYEERPADTAAAIAAFRDFADPSPSSGGGPSLVCWQQDFPLLVGPVNHVLGAECRSMPHLHWHSFLAAYMEIPPDSVFAQTLRIREKLARGVKLDKAERDFFRRNPGIVHVAPALTNEEVSNHSEWDHKSKKSPA